MNGTVKWINPTKGFAFITGEDGVDRFTHFRDFLDRGEWDRLREGAAVSFVPRETERGPRAVDVELA